MPIYAFECEACGHEFERLQKMSDEDPKQCPACSKETVRRQLTAPQFRLSGSGWYETDFKKDGDKKRNLAGDSGNSSGTATSSDSAKSETKTESKPAAKESKAEAKPATKTAE
jgi:putative FmdB family regulatory protein